MRVLLVDYDSLWPNLALMKLSTYHKERGDDVTLKRLIRNSGRHLRYRLPKKLDLCGYLGLTNVALDPFDKIYLSRVFNFEQNDIRKYFSRFSFEYGGSGIDSLISLPEEIDRLFPDYSLYNNPDYSIGFITRGCTRRCPWCVVPQKEGEIRHYNGLEDFTPNGTGKVILLDNNFLAWEGSSDYMREVMIPSGKKFSMTQGFDIRLLDEKNWSLLMKINWHNSSPDWKTREIVFGFDDYSMKEIVREKLEMMKSSGYSTSNIKFLLLYDYNTTLSQDLERLHVLNQYNAQGFWMRFRNINGTPKPEVKDYVDCKITDFPNNIFRVRGARRNVRSFLAYLTQKGIQIPREYIRLDMTRDLENKQHRLEVRLALRRLTNSIESKQVSQYS